MDGVNEIIVCYDLDLELILCLDKYHIIEKDVDVYRIELTDIACDGVDFTSKI